MPNLLFPRGYINGDTTMSNNTFYKAGSYTAVTLVGEIEELTWVPAKPEPQWHEKLQRYIIRMSAGYNQRTPDGRMTIDPVWLKVPLYYDCVDPIRVGRVVKVEGTLRVQTVVPKSDTNKFAVTQLVVELDDKVDSLRILAGSTDNYGCPGDGVNRAEIVGRVGSLRQVKTNAGKTGAIVSVAVTRTKKTENGYQDTTDWIEATFWGKRAEYVLSKLGKGDLVLITGKLNLRSMKIGNAVKPLLGLQAEDFHILSKKLATTAAPAVDDELVF